MFPGKFATINIDWEREREKTFIYIKCAASLHEVAQDTSFITTNHSCRQACGAPGFSIQIWSFEFKIFYPILVADETMKVTFK